MENTTTNESFFSKNKVTLAIFGPAILLMGLLLLISIFVCTPEKMVGQDVEEQTFGNAAVANSENANSASAPVNTAAPSGENK